MNLEQVQLLAQIVVRWTQANRKNELLDWHSFTDWLVSLAFDEMQKGKNVADREFALDLRDLSELSYQRSLELMPVESNYLVAA